MKKYSLIILTLVTVMIAMSAMMIFGTSAADANEIYSGNVIFISDNNSIGDGSGRDAANPLRPVAVDSFFIDEETKNGATYGKYYLRHALYQAAEKLVNTGGTIVICGPVELKADDAYGSGATAKDFYFPESDHPIVITGKYNGEDYSDSAYLFIDKEVHLGMGAPTTFENIKIKNAGTNRVIAGRGNKLVMGEGIVCENAVATEPSATNSSYSNFLTIVGGTRHGDFKGGTDVTIKSGSYAYVSGGNWGTASNNVVKDAVGNVIKDKDGNDVKVTSATNYIYGDINLTIEGNPSIYQVRTMVVSGYNVLVDGDVNVTLGGNAKYYSSVYATEKNKHLTGGFLTAGNEVYVKVLGGQFADSAIEKENRFGTEFILDYDIEKGEYVYPVTYDAAKITIDLAAASVGSSNGRNADYVYNKVITNFNGIENATVLYPTAWLVSVSATRPTTPSTIIDGVFRPTDAKVTATFTNKQTSSQLTQVVEFDERNEAFSERYDLDYNGTGKKIVFYNYGTEVVKRYSSVEFTNYVKAPEVSLLGARIKVKGSVQNGSRGTVQGLRFVAEYTPDNEVVIKEKGVLAVKSHLLEEAADLSLTGTYGNIRYVADSKNDWTADGKQRFEVEFVNINQSEYTTNYSVRAYVIYTVNGTEYVAYSDVVVKNPYDVAKAAVANTAVETETARAFLSNNLISVADTFDPTFTYNPEGIDALRKKVVDYMELMANLEWKPEKTFAMYNKIGETDVDSVRHQNSGGSYVQGVGMSAVFIEDKTYYGMPYTSSSTPWMQTSNFESFLPLMAQTYDRLYEFDLVGTNREKGVVANPFPQDLTDWNNGDSIHKSYDGMASWLKLNLDEVKEEGQTYSEKEQAYLNYTIVPGSHCSKSVFSAWNLVLNNSDTVNRLTATYRVVPGSNSNVIAVGNYNYKGLTEDNNTEQIITNNGVVFKDKFVLQDLKYHRTIDYNKSNLDVMYAAYSALKPGDALIHYTDSGHTRLVVSVDTANKIVTTLECANWTVPYVNMDDPRSNTAGVKLGFEANNSCWKVREYSYDNLLIETYIPSRLIELSTGLVDDLSVIVTDTDIAKGELNGIIKSNMQIVSARVTIGGVTKDIYLTSEAMHLAEYDIKDLGIEELFGLTKGQSYSIKLEIGTPGYVSEYSNDSKYPNKIPDVYGNDGVAVGYTPTFTTVWNNMPFVA